MWFDGIRQPNTLYVASVSRGKDSTAMLRAIQLMGWPLDAIVSVDIWATDTIPAELPPMVAFKEEWDKKCFDWFGVPVTRLCAMKKVPDSQAVNAEREATPREPSDGERHPQRWTYELYFYSEHIYSGTSVKFPERDGIYGFPVRVGAWCNGHLKVAALSESNIRTAFLSYSKAAFKECSSRERPDRSGRPLGFPQVKGNWCQSNLKRGAFQGGDGNLIHLTQTEQSRVSRFQTTDSLGATVSNEKLSDGCQILQGFPHKKVPWCNEHLKVAAFPHSPRTRGRK